MAKKKGNKKGQQGWDGYEVEGQEAAAAEQPKEEAGDASADAAADSVAAMSLVDAADEWPEDDRKAKKGKKGKKGANSAPAPAEEPEAEPEPAAEPQAAAVDAADEWPEDDRKAKKGKGKGKKGAAATPAPAVAEDEPEPEPAAAPAPEPAVDAADEWPEDDRKGKKGKKNKKGGGAAAPASPAPAEEEPEPAAAAPAPETADAADEWPEDDRKAKKGGKKAAKKGGAETPTAADDSASAADTQESKAPLSKKEEKKLRRQRQKEKEAEDAKKLMDAEIAKEMVEAKKAEGKAGAKKKKAGAAPIAALQKMLAAQKEAEEEARRIEEEARRREEEEQKRIEEEERMKEEQRRLKKEKEKAKKEQLRKEGKLMTKTQKEAAQRNKLKLEQLMAAGIVVEGMMNKDDEGGETKKKRVVYGDKKKKKKQDEQTSRPETPQEETAKHAPVDHKLQRQLQREKEQASAPSKAAPAKEEAKPKVEEPPAPEPEPEDDGAKDDWEMPSEDEAAKKEDEDVKDAWDASSDEEEEEKVKEEPKSKGVAKPPAPGKKQVPAASNSDDESESEENSDEDESDSDDDSDDEETEHQRQERLRREEAAARREARHQAALAARSKDDLRSPICCILGHVDTGKTKLLDKIRQTNVQEGEAGGITQQIGATYFPQDAIKTKMSVMKEVSLDIKVPGLLIIDTPGHESFTNLRSRGSSLCNIAILVVDIMHGLEPQTLESLNLLRQRKTPFIVALNKIDRIYGWKASANDSFQATYAKQSAAVKKEFEDRLTRTKLAFAEQGLNSEVWYENKNMARFVSLVPTSAITGEGIPDLLYLLVHLTQTRMSDSLMYVGELEATVLEVKVIEGLGTTIDVILSNGVLRESDRIIVCGLDGPIATNIRALLTPQPLRELRVKSQYQHHKQIKAAMGIKISANGLEKAIAGSRLLVVQDGDDEEELKEEVQADLAKLMDSVAKTDRGVWVQASTLGSLEALMQFLKDMKIPVSGINIGPVHRKDVVKASIMLERAKEYAVMLCFDVKVDKDAQDLADDVGVTVFKADIIYHLFDKFTAYHKDMMEQKRKDAAPVAVFPCVLKIVPGAVFNKRDPIILGVDVVEGVLRIGTPICVLAPAVEGADHRPIITLGKVTSIEMNHKPMEVVKKGQAGAGVAIKIECPTYETPKLVGRHFTEKDQLLSKITRESIDILKENFKADMGREEWMLIIKLKKLFNIV